MAFLCAYQYCPQPVSEHSLFCETHTDDVFALRDVRERLGLADGVPEEYNEIEEALSEYSWLTEQVRAIWMVLSARTPETLTLTQAREAIEEVLGRFEKELPDMYQEPLKSSNPYLEAITSIPVQILDID